MDRYCPDCGALLQRLVGRDGWQVEPTQAGRQLVERRVIAAVYACPHCEHVEGGRP